MVTLAKDNERIELRTSPETKYLLSRAAATAGVSLSNFMIASAQDRAQQLLAETEALNLSPRDWDAFFAALDNVDQLRPKLAVAASDYVAWRNQQINSGDSV